MPEFSVDALAYVAAAGVVVLAVAVGLRAWIRRRPDLEELERRRRAAIHSSGKMVDGAIIDVTDVSLVYTYSVRGVEYTASQDISAIQDRMPRGRFTLAGLVSVKYDQRNPANSIVLSEEWSGLRSATPSDGASTEVQEQER